MPNDFSNDTHCKAVWNLDDGALTVDSKGSNTLTNTNGVVANTVDFKEGDASAEFVAASGQTLVITDANLDAGFPLKNGDTNKEISVCCWVKLTDFTLVGWEGIWSKYESAANTRSMELGVDNATQRFKVFMGIGTGSSSVNFSELNTTVVADRWYHVTVTYRDSDKSWRIRVWDDTAQTAVESTGNTTSFINVEDAPFHINGNPSGNELDIIIDEFVVFSDILTVAEIDDIRGGTYSKSTNNFADDDDCKAVWDFENGALLEDSKGTNDLTNVGAVNDTQTFKVGDASAEMNVSQSMYINDADLDPNFPLKSGDTDKIISACCWVRFKALPGNWDAVWSKYKTSGGERSLALGVDPAPGSQRVTVLLGYNGGASGEAIVDTSTIIATNIWYHISFSFDDSDKSWVIRIWDDTNKVVGETSGNSTNNVNISTARWQVNGNAAGNELDINIDEFVAFKKILTSAEMDEIRNGIFGTEAPPSKSAKVLHIVYDTPTSGTMWYVEASDIFEKDDVIMASDSGFEITADEVTNTAPSFYPLGEIKMLSGANDGERREIIKDEGNETTLMWPMPNDLEAGDTYEIFPGCDKVGNTCRDKFDNKPNFRGYMYIPRPEETLS
jgi:hypothetical protein